MPQRFQFSLRALSVAILLVCVAFLALILAKSVIDNPPSGFLPIVAAVQLGSMVAGASLGGAAGALFGRPKTWILGGVLLFPVVVVWPAFVMWVALNLPHC